jgi:hypothetical protein
LECERNKTLCCRKHPIEPVAKQMRVEPPTSDERSDSSPAASQGPTVQPSNTASLQRPHAPSPRAAAGRTAQTTDCRRDFDTAVLAKLTFKSPQMYGYARALIKRAIELHDHGVGYFGPSDLPEALHPKDGKTSGCAMSWLMRIHVVERVGLHKPDADPPVFFGERVSKRPSRNGAKERLYKLTRRAMGEHFLADTGGVTPSQGEFWPKAAQQSASVKAWSGMEEWENG